MDKTKNKILPAILGLGYVGLPIFLQLQKKYKTIGFDINLKRINGLKHGLDITKEFKKKELKLRNKSALSSRLSDLKKCNFYIVTVPTPIFKNNNPDLTLLKNCCIMISSVIKKNDIIFFESTVYPGITENICGKIIEKKSGLKQGHDFFLGYSPERINPGDKKHTVNKIFKIVSSNHKPTLDIGKKVYSLVTKKIITTNNIQEAESAKAIENIQRDLNIGLKNEIYKVCYKAKIDFKNVIKLASTKWNFLKFEPGLVGGHCLPVDPYYYSSFAKKIGIKTNILLSGRKTNDQMYKFIFQKLLNEIKRIPIKKENLKILTLGITYKKNVPDLRNSFALKIFKLLKSNFKKVDSFDPLLNNSNLNYLISDKKKN
jgi:UDP-N-acetyl-D-galactosamine dehydrogenase